MPRSGFSLWLALAAGALALGLPGQAILPAAAAERLTAEAGSCASQWTISWQGQPLMVYVFDPQKFKPFLQTLNTVNGYGVLRNSPADHLHHHALMYGITVNGVNFWEETAGCGVQKVVETAPPELLVSPAGLPQARLTQLLYWISPAEAFLPNTNTPALLIERRILTLTVDPANRETALLWQSRFELGTKTNVVTLSGKNYHGLGMRFLKELDPVAVHWTPASQLDLSDSKQIVAPYAWEAVTFDIPGKPATIAVFGASSNARGEPCFFSMKTPFAYVSATQNLDREPLIYRRGDHFELSYLVTLYPEVKSTAALSQRARAWADSPR